MPVDNTDLVSESDFNDVPLDIAIKDAVTDIQATLNNLQQGLLTIIDHDEIVHEEYALVWELVNEFQFLAKDLKLIVKSFKPMGFKLGLRVDDLEKINN